MSVKPEQQFSFNCGCISILVVVILTLFAARVALDLYRDLF